MTDLHLFFEGEFRHGAAEPREVEEGIEAEAVGAFRGGCDDAFAGALGCYCFSGLAVVEEDDAAKAGGPFFFRDVFQDIQEFRVVSFVRGVFPGEAGGVDARTAI